MLAGAFTYKPLTDSSIQIIPDVREIFTRGCRAQLDSHDGPEASVKNVKENPGSAASRTSSNAEAAVCLDQIWGNEAEPSTPWHEAGSSGRAEWAAPPWPVRPRGFVFLTRDMRWGVGHARPLSWLLWVWLLL